MLYSNSPIPVIKEGSKSLVWSAKEVKVDASMKESVEIVARAAL
jgi:hypothetical protein